MGQFSVFTHMQDPEGNSGTSTSLRSGLWPKQQHNQESVSHDVQRGRRGVLMLLMPPSPPHRPTQHPCAPLSLFAASFIFNYCCLISPQYARSHTRPLTLRHTLLQLRHQLNCVSGPFRAVTAVSGRLINDYFTLHLTLSACLFIKCR